MSRRSRLRLRLRVRRLWARGLNLGCPTCHGGTFVGDPCAWHAFDR